MLKKISIISFGLFFFSGLLYTNVLPLDLSIITMILPIVYFAYWTTTKLVVNKSVLIILVFAVMILLSFVYNQNDPEKMRIFLMSFFVLGIISPSLLKDKEDHRFFFNSILITSLLISCISVFNLQNWQQERLDIGGSNPIWLARAIAISALGIYTLYLYKRIKTITFVFLISLILLLMFTTGSRGPLVSLVIVAIIIAKSTKSISSKSSYTLYKGILLCFVMIMLIVFILNILPDHLTNRIISVGSGESTQIRFVLIKDAIEIIREHPLGIGLGKFGAYSIVKYPHNIVLESLSELGWFTGSSLIFIIVASGIGLALMRNRDMYHTFFFGLYLMSFINALFSGDLTSPKEIYAMIPIGLSYYFERRAIVNTIKNQKGV